MTTTLSLSSLTLPSAPVGPSNPLPPVATMPEPPYQASTEGLPEEIVANLGYGRVTSIYPYLLQDAYTRDRHSAEMRVAVLENEHLRAEFALDLGGRLIRLLDRATGRDLVYRNAQFQPANLALRNAWFSGGVEWNIGMRGHWPLTCDPMYAAEVTGPDGEPVLRMWEYERKRGLIVQIDATLDTAVAALHVQVTVRNPHAEETGMYWWTNIAVAQTPGSRVYAPATHAYQTQYDGSLGHVDLADPDVSRPAHAAAAADWFYDVRAAAAGGEVTPWLVALEPDGSGLGHLSTMPLFGNKLFVWGDTAGGHHWCSWLGGETGEYFEIQAGLATTQYEHIPMPGGETWTWREAFLPVQVDDDAKDAEWAAAVPVVGDAVLRAAAATDGGARLDAVADAAPTRLLQAGAPWGALEQEATERAGASFATLPGVTFDRSAGGAGDYWTALLDGSADDHADTVDAPASYVEGTHWERLLAAAPATWLTHYHRGSMAHARGDLARAASHYEASLRQRRTAWALRGLGLVRLADGDADGGLALLADAVSLAPESVPLVRELGEALLAAGRAEEAAHLVAAQPSAVRELGRMRVLSIRAALDLGDTATAGRLLEDPFEVADIREGELSMSDLWRRTFPDRPVPAHFDFSMS